jgi:hypothetical protein
MIVGGMLAIEKLIRCVVVAWATRTPVEGVCRRGKSFRPERRRNGGVKKKGANTIIQSAKHTLSAAVLLGCIWTREAEDHAIGGQKRAQGVVVKFTAIICLQTGNRAAELSANICMETDDGG